MSISSDFLSFKILLHSQRCDSVAVVLYCCSDFRLCNRGLAECCHDSEEMPEPRAETDSVHSDDQAASGECGSTDPADTVVCHQVEKKTDAVIFDGEFAQDVELMKSMGLPLSFTQASERCRKKVRRVC